MPRLPTIRVIGSQAISVSLPASGWILSRTAIVFSLSLVAPARLVAGCELRPVVAPLRLLVHRLVGDRPELADERPVALADRRRQPAARRCVHERHELVGEARHRAADADPPDVWTAA